MGEDEWLLEQGCWQRVPQASTVNALAFPAGIKLRDCSCWPWNTHPSVVCMESWWSIHPMLLKHQNKFLQNVLGVPFLPGKAGCRTQIQPGGPTSMPNWPTLAYPPFSKSPWNTTLAHMDTFLSRYGVPSLEECPKTYTMCTHTTTHVKALPSLYCSFWSSSGLPAQLSFPPSPVSHRTSYITNFVTS